MAKVPLPPDPLATNHAWWEAAARAHRGARSGYYDPAPMLAGDRALTPHEEAALAQAMPGGLQGKEVLHLQCHLALDGIRLARRGARVTGLDFSAEALEGAAALARACGVELALVQADATRLPPDLFGRFDLVWATVGVISWHKDPVAWMRTVSQALRPGGRLVLHDLHPLYNMPATTRPLVSEFPYGGGSGFAFEEVGTYAASAEAMPAATSVSFAHSLGEVVNAALEAGLRIERLDEHLDASFDPRQVILQEEADGLFRWRLGEGLPGAEPLPLPVLFTLIAGR